MANTVTHGQIIVPKSKPAEAVKLFEQMVEYSSAHSYDIYHTGDDLIVHVYSKYGYNQDHITMVISDMIEHINS